MYGSNTTHDLREGSQLFMSAAKGTAACWQIHSFINNIIFTPYLTAYFFTSNISKLVSASYESPCHTKSLRSRSDQPM
jgi:hypothetical protein